MLQTVKEEGLCNTGETEASGKKDDRGGDKRGFVSSSVSAK